MSHIIAEAIIENGQLKYVDKKLPRGRIKAHIIYDSIDNKIKSKVAIAKIVTETSGIYKNINAEFESLTLREGWDRDVEN